MDSNLDKPDYKDTEMFQNDIIPAYDLALDKEDAWMTDAVFDKLFPAEHEMLNNALGFHQDEGHFRPQQQDILGFDGALL